ncbi:MAG TPA: AAA family ATPase [Nitrospira sp.]|nr:AAA family ATPase [Nitrospira sp.]
MKLERLWIKDYKNLRNCEIDFPRPQLLNAVIGSNGSGKSNIIEAILHILLGVYFKKAPPFDFMFEFEAQNRRITLESDNRKMTVMVDGEEKSLRFFADRLREGAAQVYYPEVTLVYYSGECQRVNQLIGSYRRHFERLTRKPESDRNRPLFVQTTNAQAQVILLALYAHGHLDLLDRLGLKRLIDVVLVLRSPSSFDSKQHEPKLWNTVGAVRRVIGAIHETASSEESRRKKRRPAPGTEDDMAYSEQRTYGFDVDKRADKGLTALATRLARGGDNIYLALEHLRARGIFGSVSFRLIGRSNDEPFEFDQLSEGEKQLLAVVGALKLTNSPDNLVLLDEPDTHLNPQWSWDYPSMLTDALDTERRSRSTVLMATHTPIMISGMTSDQVLLARHPSDAGPAFMRPRRHPRGQGIANLLCSSEYFGLPSSLDKETQKLLDERLAISIKEFLTSTEKLRLKTLNSQLEILSPGVSERDPAYVEFLRRRVVPN